MRRDELYNRLIEAQEMVSRIKSRSYVSGRHRAIVKKGGLEFERSAPFDFGQDDARKFAWRLSAKLNKPMKVYKIEKKENVFVCAVMLHPAMSFGKTRILREYAIELAGVLGLTALATDDHASLAIVGLGQHAMIRRCDRNRNLFIAQLMDLYDLPHVINTDDVIEDTERLAHLIPAGSSVFIISDWIFPPDPAQPGSSLSEQASYKRFTGCVRGLSARCEVGLILVDDIRSRELPPGIFRARSGPNAFTLLVQGERRAVVAELERLCQERLEWLERHSMMFAYVDCCNLTTTDDMMEYLPDVMVYLSQRHAM